MIEHPFVSKESAVVHELDKIKFLAKHVLYTLDECFDPESNYDNKAGIHEIIQNVDSIRREIEMVIKDRNKVCAIIGADINGKSAAELKKAIEQSIIEGYTAFVCYCSLPVALEAGKYVSKIKGDLGLSFELFIPSAMESVFDSWNNAELEQFFINSDVFRFIICESKAISKKICVQYMVEMPDGVIAVYNGKPGWVMDLLRQAKKNGKEIKEIVI